MLLQIYTWLQKHGLESTHSQMYMCTLSLTHMHAHKKNHVQDSNIRKSEGKLMHDISNDGVQHCYKLEKTDFTTL